VQTGESIASEGKGHYMYVEGKILTTKGEPIPGATIDTWESDGDGIYDNQVRLNSYHFALGVLTIRVSWNSPSTRIEQSLTVEAN
jgi:protocatechuate 3,4-dioxygenase beta subunit